MQTRFVPSRLLGPLVPGFVRQKWQGEIDAALTAADSVFAGSDERALALRTALITFSVRIVSAIIAYASQVLLARWLGSYEYGIFVWVWVAALIVSGFACMGFPSAVLRFVPEYLTKKNDAALRGITFSSRFYSVIVATVMTVLGIGAVYVFDETITSAFVLPLFLGFVCLPILALGETQEGLARAFNWSNLALSPTYIIRPVLILVSMAIAVAAGFAPTASTALVATIIATWITSVGQMLAMNKRISNVVPHGPQSNFPKIWIAVAAPIFLVEGFFALMTHVDILIVGLYLTPKDVAIYFASVKTLALVHFVYFAVRSGAAHRFAQYYTTKDSDRFETLAQDTVRWTFWPSLVLGLIVLALGNILLGFFGADFTSGYPLLFILVLGVIARASVGPAESVLTMTGNQSVCAAVYGATFGVNVILNLSLIPIYGLYGAAWATTISMFFEAAALYSITQRRLGVHMFPIGRRDSAASHTTSGEVG